MRRARAAWLATGGLGVALLVPFDATITIAAGVLLLVAFVVWGVFLIAAPAFLEDDGER